VSYRRPWRDVEPLLPAPGGVVRRGRGVLWRVPRRLVLLGEGAAVHGGGRLLRRELLGRDVRLQPGGPLLPRLVRLLRGRLVVRGGYVLLTDGRDVHDGGGVLLGELPR